MKKEGIIANLFWKFSERILAQLISTVVSIVLARLLMPEDYGGISMVTVFIAFANILVTSGIPEALVQKKDADQLDFSSVFYLNIGLSILLYILLFFTAPFVARFYRMPELANVLRVLGIRVIVSGVNGVQHAYVSRNMMFRMYFWSTLFGTLLSAVVGIVMAYSGFGVWALVAQYLTNTTTDTVVLWFTVKWRPTLAFSFQRVKGLFSFGWKMLVQGVSDTFFTELRQLIIGRQYTSEDLAYYNRGQAYPKLIITNISAAISSVLFPAMSSIQNDREKVKTLMRKSVVVSSYVVFPMLVGMGIVAEPFIRLLLTDKWIGSVPFLRIYCISSLFSVGLYPRHQALLGTGKSGIHMVEHQIVRVFSLILLICVYRLSVIAIALTGIFSSVVLTLVVMYTSKKYNDYQYREQIADVFPIIIGCIIMGVSVYCILFLGLPTHVTLAVQIVAGILIYYLYSRIFRLEGYKFFIDYARRFRNRKQKEG